MYTIGQLSSTCDTKIPTIRYYEEVGLLSAPSRSSGNHRLYSEEHRERLTFIYRAKRLGFSQREIKELLALGDVKPDVCGQVMSLTTTHLKIVKSKIEELKQIEKTLKSLLLNCKPETGKNCPIIEGIQHPTN